MKREGRYFVAGKDEVLWSWAAEFQRYRVPLTALGKVLAMLDSRLQACRVDLAHLTCIKISINQPPFPLYHITAR